MVEVQDIFQFHGDEFKHAYSPSYDQCKAMSTIIKCRTATLGGHMDVCGSCGNVQISYNSCRNRHCPKCQMLAKERWIDNQKHNLLNVGYFHTVFTVPDALRTIFYQNQALMYGLLFRAVSETLQELAGDKKFLGATLGFTAILHTWGQNLNYHPHIHCIIPAGGLNSLQHWVHSRKKFFLPIKVLSCKFRGKLLDYLKNAKLNFYGEQQYLQNPECFHKLLDACYNKEWIVYCKPPFKTSASVVEYLGRYTHRVAISNNRILKLENGMVSFKWRDYRDNNRWKVMTVTAVEFIRRFLMHILPSGFMKIRHFGIMGNRNKTAKLILCKKLTNTPITQKIKASTLELIKKILGKDISKCPGCGAENLFSKCLSPPTFAI